MDQRADIVEQDIKDIVQTRLEISRKIRLLDQTAPISITSGRPRPFGPFYGS
jgi:hypothetical protein